jgi:hypothetical protein
MLFISGTKRSGTSMWMQVMAAAGIPVLGQAFPRDWEKTIKDANPDGFYESLLRQGVYYRTNPHPVTGRYFVPDEVRGYAVKVFIPGVVRSECAYIDHLIANVRAWREYEASIQRLYAMESSRRPPNAPQSFHFPPAYEWWMENFALVRDISLRRYPARLQTYDQVLADPAKMIASVLEWVGHGNIEQAVAAVKPEHRTQRDVMESDAVDADLAQVFDDLYGAIDEGKSFSKAMLQTLNDTNKRLLPRLVELQTKVAQSMMAQPRTGKGPQLIEGLPSDPSVDD